MRCQAKHAEPLIYLNWHGDTAQMCSLQLSARSSRVTWAQQAAGARPLLGVPVLWGCPQPPAPNKSGGGRGSSSQEWWVKAVPPESPTGLFLGFSSFGGLPQPLSCSTTKREHCSAKLSSTWGTEQQEAEIDCTGFGGSAYNQTTSFSAASLFLASCGSGCREQPGGCCSLLGPTCRKFRQLRKQEFCFPSQAGLELSCVQSRGLLDQGGNEGDLNPSPALFNCITLLSPGLC